MPKKSSAFFLLLFTITELLANLQNQPSSQKSKRPLYSKYLTNNSLFKKALKNNP